MEKKNGFTLTELLAVVALLAVLVVIAVPNVLKLFNKSNEETMTIQENQVLDAANVFVNDFCIRPLSKNRGHCGDFVKKFNSDDTKRYICLSVLQNNGNQDGSTYLGTVNYKGGIPCNGFITYSVPDEFSTYQDGKVYLQCGGTDGYETEGLQNVKDGSDKLITICGGV